MNLQILTPEEVIFNGDVQSIILPGKDGVFQLLNNHAPIVSSLTSGNILIKAKETANLSKKINVQGENLTYDIKGGILEMNNNKVIILCD